MIKVENIDVWGFEHAIRGMRNPMNSWEKSDSKPGEGIGENDLKLMRSLYKAGSDHRKFMRQIMVSMDITAPLYWWKEFDTYKVGTVVNSCSTMHKLMAKGFGVSDFSMERVGDVGLISSILSVLNSLRDTYINFDEHNRLIKGVKREDVWYALIQVLPESYNQLRTVTMNYEVAASMINQRTGHRLDEWKEFVDTLQWDLPWLADIMD